MKIGIVIPARDEEETVGQVVQRCRLLVSWTDEIRIVVCDNGSIDGTRTEADKAGAEVVYASKFGYGLACLTAVGELGTGLMCCFSSMQTDRVGHKKSKICWCRLKRGGPTWFWGGDLPVST